MLNFRTWTCKFNSSSLLHPAKESRKDYYNTPRPQFIKKQPFYIQTVAFFHCYKRFQILFKSIGMMRCEKYGSKLNPSVLCLAGFIDDRSPFSALTPLDLNLHTITYKELEYHLQASYSMKFN